MELPKYEDVELPAETLAEIEEMDICDQLKRVVTMMTKAALVHGTLIQEDPFQENEDESLKQRLLYMDHPDARLDMIYDSNKFGGVIAVVKFWEENVTDFKLVINRLTAKSINDDDEHEYLLAVKFDSAEEGYYFEYRNYEKEEE